VSALGGISAIEDVSLASAMQTIKSEAVSLPSTLSPAAIRDAAFERLLLVASDSYGDATASTTASRAMELGGESLGDFILTNAPQTVEDSVASKNTLDIEREALDEVLRGLHDVSGLPSDLTEGLVDSGEEVGTHNTDVALEPSSDAALTADDIEGGGMVLLQATGDANESAYDLVAASGADAEFINAHLGMEASVGLHQALDVAADVSSPTSRDESLPDADATPASEPQASATNKAEKPLVRQAAATVGATALFGLFARNRGDERRRKSAEAYQARMRPVMRVLRPGE
jgi:hypothetical protein